MYKVILLAFFLITFSLFPAAAQTADRNSPDVFVAPVVEALGYSREGASFGFGVMAGAGNGIAAGIRLLYAFDTDEIYSLSLDVFMRYYFLGMDANTGIFIQPSVGMVILNTGEAVSFPSRSGSITLSMSAGWRILMTRNFFLEPAVRFGYPFLVGAGLAAGFSF